jgi:hypothetical protein
VGLKGLVGAHTHTHTHTCTHTCTQLGLRNIHVPRAELAEDLDVKALVEEGRLLGVMLQKISNADPSARVYLGVWE